MMKELHSLENLIEEFAKFPSIGSKTAERMAYSILDMNEEEAAKIATAILNAKRNIHTCPVCGLLTENEKCNICQDETRNHNICIVLQNAKDVTNFERLNNYFGTYHVLGGVISGIKGIGPEDLRINELLERIDKESIKELIIATNPTIEGETTALYLSKILEDKDIKVSRLAYGIPAGGNLEYVDEVTMMKAIDNRTELK